MKSFQEALEWLYGLQLFGVRLGLESMERLVVEMGLQIQGRGPSEPLPSVRPEGGGRPKIIHVAGTNGKGSTCAMIASVCCAGGLSVALYTSPHLICFRERIQINGEPISEAGALEGLRRIHDLVQQWDLSPTFFEVVTALALDWFQQNEVQVLVLETGLGGRLDATNIVTPTVSVLSPIGMDHVQILGGSLRAIAEEKTGIIKAGIPVVSAPQEPEVKEVIQFVSEKKGASVSLISDSWGEGVLGLSGATQRWNAALALRALEVAGVEISSAAQLAGLEKVRWPGRFQKISERLIIDGAHNEHAARVLVSTWEELYPREKAAVIFGALEDKDAAAVLCALRPIMAELIVVPVFSPRAFAPEDLARIARGLLPSIPCRAVESLSEALTQTTECRGLVTGSLYLIGEVLASLQGAKPEWSSQ